MKQCSSPILVFCAVLLMIPALTPAEEQTKTLLAVRGDGSYPPFEIYENGQLSGIHIDLVSAVASRMNVEMKFRSLPWNRAVNTLRKGEADAITFMNKTKTRERFAYFFEGNILSIERNYFAVLKDRKDDIGYSGNLEQLKDCIVGVVYGYSYSPAFDHAAFLKKDDGARDERQLLKKLIAGRFDVAAGNIYTIKYLAREMGVSDRIEFLKPPFSSTPTYIAFSKLKDPTFAEHFAEEMAAFKQTPQYAEILKKYGVNGFQEFPSDPP